MSVKKLSKEITKAAKTMVKEQKNESDNLTKSLGTIGNNLKHLAEKLPDEAKTIDDVLRNSFSARGAKLEDLKEMTEHTENFKIVSAAP